ncbi:zinc ribbon domain-containing protein [uncultured Sneathiella sp.]|uniref:FmdB family zinc ribbon protein n=1 Tax=uncultured Sneathiella sp. TaxID=879315 RepID=UPI0030EF3772
MPIYRYSCENCGPFDDMAHISDYAKPGCCPTCGANAPRMMSAPRLAIMEAGTRHAHATNEKSAHEPKKSSHGPGCGCCGGGGKKINSGTLHRPDGSKSFPAKRPWMISH